MDGYVTIGTTLDTKSFEAQIDQLEEKLEGLEEEYKVALKDKNFPEDELKRYQAEIEKTSNKIIDLRKKQDSLYKSNLSQMPGLISNIGNSIESVTGKVARWGLAIFGIRSAYMMIRQAMSTISAENDQISGDIQYMKWILAQTLKPVVEWIIKGLYFIIALINSISKAIFNVDILADKSADAFKNAKENAGGLSKNLKEAKKQLAGFDEMNVLQEPSSGGGGGGLGDWEAPDLGDYTKQVNKGVDEWEKFGKEMDETLKNTTLEDWFKAFGNWGLAVRGVTEFVHGLWEIVDGLAKAIKGIVEVVMAFITGDTEKLHQGIMDILDGIWEMVDGLIKAIWGLIQMIAGAIVGIVLDLVNWLVNFLEGIPDWVDKNLVKPVNDFFKWLVDSVVDFIKKGIEGVGALLIVVGDWVYKNVLLPIYNFCVAVGDWIITTIQNLIKGAYELLVKVGDWVYRKVIKPIADFFVGLWNGLKTGFKNAVDWIKNTFNNVVTFFSGIVNKIMGFFRSIGTNVGNAIGGAFKGVINGVLGAIESILNFPIRAINRLINTINKIPGINLGTLGTFSLPRLAKGGIINMPGRGVPVGGAIAGERGQEAVLPLTDSQQMALLGEAIGKYININATIPVYVANRQITREIRKIEAEDSFAFNR